jgi:hypothetical protein
MPQPPSFPETITLVRDRVRKIIGRVSVPSEMADVRSWPHNGLKSDMAPRPFCANPGLMQRSKW